MTKDAVGKSRASAWRTALSLGGCALWIVGCGPEQGSLLPPTAAGGEVTTATSGAGGSSESATTSSGGAAGSGSGDGGASGAGGATGGGGSDDAGGGGGIDPGDGGMTLPLCVFHTDPVVEAGAPLRLIADEGGVADATADALPPDAAAPSDAGSGDATAMNDAGPRGDAAGDGGARDGAGGAGDAGPAPSITMLTNPFIGSYLADSAGRTLYTYGADLPGDCNVTPISQCEKDCLIAWPLFEAGARTLAPGLDDRAFGAILRTDGSYQTTYYGWPLYYYKPDVLPGQLSGQAKAKTWHAATVIPAGIVIMKGTTADKYLGDGTGRTLYVFDQDTKGTSSSDPVSACMGTCLDEHAVFFRNRISVVSSLQPTDFSVFVANGHAQLAYKGAPLYYAAADHRSGDQNGATTPGWSVAAP